MYFGGFGKFPYTKTGKGFKAVPAAVGFVKPGGFGKFPFFGKGFGKFPFWGGIGCI